MRAADVTHCRHDIVLFIVTLVVVNDGERLQLAAELLRRDGDERG